MPATGEERETLTIDGEHGRSVRSEP